MLSADICTLAGTVMPHVKVFIKELMLAGSNETDRQLLLFCCWNVAAAFKLLLMTRYAAA